MNLLMTCYAGSIAYGTSLPTSDIDVRGIFCADPINIRTPFFNINEKEISSENDTKYYELTYFMKLLLDCNPNILDLVWVDDSDIIQRTLAYDLLLKNRAKLLSSKVAFTFAGYAYSQLKRIKSHNKWINNPQSKIPPKQTEYISLVHNFTKEKLFKIDINKYRYGYRLIPYDNNLFGLYKTNGYSTFDDNSTLNIVYDHNENFFIYKSFGFIKRRQPLFILRFNEEQYKKDKEKWKQYWDWKIPKNNKAKLFYKLEKEMQRRNL